SFAASVPKTAAANTPTAVKRALRESAGLRAGSWPEGTCTSAPFAARRGAPGAADEPTPTESSWRTSFFCPAWGEPVRLRKAKTTATPTMTATAAPSAASMAAATSAHLPSAQVRPDGLPRPGGGHEPQGHGEHGQGGHAVVQRA